MNISFLIKSENSTRLILIFPGWSCGKELYDDFRFKGWDVAIVENYEAKGLDSHPIRRYPTVCLFAWSLGVFMAEFSGIEKYITSAFALNGTLRPANDLEGIPLHIFSATAENLSPLSLKKFRRRMAGTAELFRQHFDRDFSEGETENLKQQLYHILHSQSNMDNSSLPWTKVFISREDTIFPYENMKRHWEKYKSNYDKNLEIITLQDNHYVPLERIVKYSIPNPEKISRRFSDASETYDRNALAQKEVATMLASHLKEIGVTPGLEILEVGCGTGLFTREILNHFPPAFIDLIDISDVRLAFEDVPSRFFKMDAEEWIASSEARIYDAVVSSSVMQWFVNIPLFISNVANRLKENGFFGFSTFLPGNLGELDNLRPSPIHYPTKEEIKEFLTPFFDDIRIREHTITLKFNSPKELFNHLRSTGVGGSAPSANIPLSKLRTLKNLTFRSVIVSGRKKKNEV